MNKRYALILITLLTLTLNSFAQSEQRTFEGFHWYDNFIQFTYPIPVAEDTYSYILQATDTLAERTDVVFQRYEADGGWYDSGGILSVGLISTLPTNYQELDLIDVLNTDTLDTRLSQGYVQWIPDTTYAPLQNISQGQYISTDALNGVRFTISTDRLGDIYIFEGITIDETYLVSLMMPLFKVEDTDDPIAVLDDVVRSIVITPPEASFLTRDTNGMIDYEGIQFTYNPDFASRIQVDLVPAVTGEAAQYNMFGASPAWQTFTFIREQSRNPGFDNPQIHILPAEDFPDIDSPFGYALADLRTLLENHPDLTTYDAQISTIPPVNATQVVLVQPSYIDFGSGTGIRYITHFAQDAYPLTDNDMLYMFIGLTDDGKHIVSARFPLYMESLPTFEEAEPVDYGAFMETYGTYVEDIQAELNQLPIDAFLPSIALLDTIITSIEVNR